MHLTLILVSPNTAATLQALESLQRLRQFYIARGQHDEAAKQVALMKILVDELNRQGNDCPKDTAIELSCRVSLYLAMEHKRNGDFDVADKELLAAAKLAENHRDKFILQAWAHATRGKIAFTGKRPFRARKAFEQVLKALEAGGLEGTWRYFRAQQHRWAVIQEFPEVFNLDGSTK